MSGLEARLVDIVRADPGDADNAADGVGIDHKVLTPGLRGTHIQPGGELTHMSRPEVGHLGASLTIHSDHCRAGLAYAAWAQPHGCNPARAYNRFATVICSAREARSARGAKSPPPDNW